MPSTIISGIENVDVSERTWAVEMESIEHNIPVKHNFEIMVSDFFCAQKYRKIYVTLLLPDCFVPQIKKPLQIKISVRVFYFTLIENFSDYLATTTFLTSLLSEVSAIT
jgi:hypothetical protein